MAASLWPLLLITWYRTAPSTHPFAKEILILLVLTLLACACNPSVPLYFHEHAASILCSIVNAVLAATDFQRIKMSGTEGLVDLSLFDWAPTGEHSLAQNLSTSNRNYYEPALSDTREYYAPSSRSRESIRERDDLQEAIRQSIDDTIRQHESTPAEGNIRETIVEDTRRREVATKPLPPLPRSRLCQQAASRCDDGSECILKRIKRTGTDSITSPGSLLQRRNLISTPQLTLSVPQQSPRPYRNANPAPEMVWMPDDQMWLIVGEAEPRTANVAQTAYPTPPAYTPRAFPSSEPASRVTSQWDLTPPQTPLQSQLQSLLQPRDEERLSPLFQEAMNSVPMTDDFDLPPPPSYEGCMRDAATPAPLHIRTSTSDSFHSNVSSLSPSQSASVHRALTTGGQSRPRVRSDTSSERSHSQHSLSSHSTTRLRPSLGAGNGSRSYHSTSSSRSYQTAVDDDVSLSPYQPIAASTRSWAGLARRIAQPRSAT